MKVVVKRKVTNVASHRGNVIRIDKKLPQKYHKPVILHERMEHHLMHERGFKEEKAHKIATAFEKQAFFKRKKREWRRYNSLVGGLVRQNKT